MNTPTSCYKNDDFQPDNIGKKITISEYGVPTIAILGDLEHDKVFFVCRKDNVPTPYVRDDNGNFHIVISQEALIHFLDLENAEYVKQSNGKFSFAGYGPVAYSMFGYKFEFYNFMSSSDRFIAKMVTPNGDTWTAIYDG